MILVPIASVCWHWDEDIFVVGNVFGDVIVDALKERAGLAVCTLINSFVLAN